MSQPYQAVFDVLLIADRMEEPFGGASESELHLLAYLSCLLSLYRGQPAAEWGYRFVRTTSGSPFSLEVEKALEATKHSGLMRRTSSGLLGSTERGSELCRFLGQLSTHAWRVPCITGATDSVLSLPSGLVRNALQLEPSLRSADLHKHATTLLDEGSVALLHSHFAALSTVVGPEVGDLMVPAVVWLRYLTAAALGQSPAADA